MAVTAIIATAAVVTAGAVYMAGEAKEEAAEQQAAAAEQQAIVAREREEREARIRQEQIDYEAKLAGERAEWETTISLEKAEFTSERIKEEAELVRAAQIAGYAATGLEITAGSPLVVMSETARMSEVERRQVLRGHEIFAEARAKEAAEVKKGGEYTYKWFMERLHAETGYEVESRHAEAAMFRSKATYAGYGKYLSTASSLLGGGLKAYGAYTGGGAGGLSSSDIEAISIAGG